MYYFSILVKFKNAFPENFQQSRGILFCAFFGIPLVHSSTCIAEKIQQPVSIYLDVSIVMGEFFSNGLKIDISMK